MVPTQQIQYLGFLIDSRGMKIRLTQEKVVHIVATCMKIQLKHSLPIRELARLIEKLTATLPAIYQAPLWYRELQRLKNLALQQSQSFDNLVVLSEEAMLELEWWSTKMILVNGKSVLAKDPDLIIETDASVQGWGAVCKGVRTGGQ